jgi:hypothetical protein
MIKYEALLRHNSMRKDIFGMSRQIIGAENIVRGKDGSMGINVVPSEIFEDITAGFAKGAMQVRVTFLDTLNLDGVSGRTALEDDANGEEAQTYKGITAKINMRRKGVPYYGDGPDQHELESVNGQKAINTQLSNWAADDFAYGARMAVIEYVSVELTAAPSSVTALLHPHIYAAGIDVGSSTQPGKNYSVTAATYANAVGVGAKAIPSDAQGGITLDNLARAEELCSTLNLRKLNLSKGPGYVWCMSERGRSQMMRNSEIRDMLAQGDVRGPQNQLFAGVTGPINGFYFYMDTLLPRMSIGGDEGSWTVAVTYYGHGQTDNRNGDYDINMILGAGTLFRGNAIAPHYVDHVGEDYGLKKALGISYTRTFTRMQFDIGTETDTSKVVKGSCLFLTNRNAAIS